MRVDRLVVLAVMALSAWSCSDDGDGAVASSGGETTEDQFDKHARDTCPDTISSHRLSGGRLVAAYDTTYAKAQGSLMADDTELADQPAPEVATVVCWYSDTTLTPPMGMGEAEVTDAVSIHVDDQSLSAASVEGPPERP